MNEQPPYMAALDHAFQTKAREAEDLAHEVELLRAEILKLRAQRDRYRDRYRDAHRRLELWRERHRAWQAERRELTGARR